MLKHASQKCLGLKSTNSDIILVEVDSNFD